MAAPALAAETGGTPYNCDFEPDCEVAPGAYAVLEQPVMGKFKINFGGWARLDYVHNSTNLGPTGALLPGTIPKLSSNQGEESQSLLSGRGSRLWLKITGPGFLGAKTKAFFESDFQGDFASGQENPQLRMRHYFGTLDWGTTQLLFGQTTTGWGMFPLNSLALSPGTFGGSTVTLRVPQIRLTQAVKFNRDNQLKFVLTVEDPAQSNNTGRSATFGALPNSDTGVIPPAGITTKWSDRPVVGSQLVWYNKSLGVAPTNEGFAMKDLALGVFGIYGTQEALGVSKSIKSYGYGVYTNVPILRSKDGRSRKMTLDLEASGYMGANIAYLGSTFGTTNPAISSVATANGPVATQAAAVTPLRGWGGFGHLIFYPTQQLGITLIAGRKSAYHFDDYIGLTNYAKSNTLTEINAKYDVNAAIRIGVGFDQATTRYGNVTAGTSDRGINNAYRFVAWYYF